MGFRDDADALAAQLEATRREAAQAREDLERELAGERASVEALEREVAARRPADKPRPQRPLGERLLPALIGLLVMVGLLVSSVRMMCNLDEPPTLDEVKRGSPQGGER